MLAGGAWIESCYGAGRVKLLAWVCGRNALSTIFSLFNRTVESGQSGVTIARVIPRSRSAVCSLMLVDSFVEHLLLLFLSPFSPFSVPNLLVTLSTRFADASLKYLRFSREIDWNNFSHTDSFAGWLQKRETRQSRKTNDFSSAALRYAWWSLSEILRRWQTFVTFDEFS